MPGTPIGTAYIQVLPQAKGIEGNIASLVDPAAAKASNGVKNSFGQAFKSVSLDAAKFLGNAIVGVTATGAAAIAGLTAGLTQTAIRGGISRAIGLDEARAKFKQLGMDVDAIMGKGGPVQNAVDGTRYSLDQAAQVAVLFGSSGVAIEDMEGALKSVASAASISGVAFEDMGAIYNKVASQGKLTGAEMLQLSKNGVNANAALQKHLGKTSEEITQMVSQGKIDFKTFSDAMREYFGDAADSANSTFTGALANVRAALSRTGALFASPIMESLRKVFAGTEYQADGLIQAINALNTYLAPFAERVTKIANMIGGKLNKALGTFTDVLNSGGNPIQAFKQALLDLVPNSLKAKWASLSEPMQKFLGVLGKAGGIIGGFSAGWGVLTGAIAMLAPGLSRLLGPLGSIGGMFAIVQKAGGGLMNILPDVVGRFSAMASATGGLGSRLGALMGPFGWAVTAFGLMFAKSEAFRKAVMGLVQTIGTNLIGVFQSLQPIFSAAIAIIGKLAQVAGNVLAPVIKAASTIIGAALKAITWAFDKLGGIVSKVTSVFNRIKNAITSPIETAKRIVKSAIDKIRGLFPLKLGKIFSGIKLPHFKISGGKAPWGIGGKGTKPSIGIEWYAKGGIMDDPTIFAMAGGEAGPEAILPLDPFWAKMDAMANSIVSGVATVAAAGSGYAGDITIPIYLYPSGPKMGEEVVKAYDVTKKALG